MNAKFQWFGFSVARKHIYFYTLLIATSLFANTLKDSLLGGPVIASETTQQLAEFRAQWEAEQSLNSLP